MASVQVIKKVSIDITEEEKEILNKAKKIMIELNKDIFKYLNEKDVKDCFLEDYEWNEDDIFEIAIDVLDFTLESTLK